MKRKGRQLSLRVRECVAAKYREIPLYHNCTQLRGMMSHIQASKKAVSHLSSISTAGIIILIMHVSRT